QKLDNMAGYSAEPEPVSQPDPVDDSPEPIELSHKSDDISPSKDETASQSSTEASSKVEKNDSTDISEDSSESDNKDAYGNEVVKTQKTYTEEEVQRMIRERLARGQYAQQQQQAAQQQAAKDFTPDPNSTESWEVQLENFVEQTLQKRESKLRTAQQQAQDQQLQAQFEEKFTNGMAKYKDFKEVVASQPITDSMMMAARGMEDPAAFIYAASKNFSQELQRISKLVDPFMQAAEIGKLESRMRKGKSVSNAPSPVKNVKSDMTDKPLTPKRNIDDMIRQHANSRLRR